MSFHTVQSGQDNNYVLAVYGIKNIYPVNGVPSPPREYMQVAKLTNNDS